MPTITTSFDVGGTVYYVDGAALKSAVVVSITTVKTASGTTITYGFNTPIPISEDRLFATAQEAADDFSENMIADFEDIS